MSSVQDFYNFMQDSDQDPVSTTATTALARATGRSANRYARYLSSKASNGDIGSLMNGVIRQKLMIIPKNVR